MMEVVSLAMNWITLIGALAQGKYLGLSKLHIYRAIMVIVCKSFPSYTVKAVLGSGTYYNLYTVQVFPPRQYVVVAGGTATFQCFSLHGNVISVQWLVNGSQNHTLANVMKEMRDYLH